MNTEPKPADEAADNQANAENPSIYPEPTKGIGAMPAFSSGDSHVEQSPTSTGDATSDLPMPVIQVLSVHGVEYTLMTLCLWMFAGALAWTLLALVNGLNSFSILAFPISLMLVTLPIFAFFFLRLKKSEVANPELRFDASKRRLSQFTQVIAFATCLFNVIAFVYMVMTKISGEGSIPIWKSFVNLIIVLVVAGGIFAYYWNDEHRTARQR